MSFSRLNRSRRWIRPVAALAIALSPIALSPAPTHAQIILGPGGGSGGPGSRISKQALEQYAKVLSLDDAQRQAAAALHEAYTQSNLAASKSMQSKMKELQSDINDGDKEAIESKLPAVMQEHATKTAEIEQSFLSDLKALLTAQQSDSTWPKFERLRRREQGLRSGVLSGSNVDLFTVVDKMNMPAPDRAKLNDTLDQYELDLDRALTEIAHAREADAADQPVKGAGAGGRVFMTFDPGSMRDRMKKQRDDSTRVRDINQRYARLLAAALPDDLRAQLEEQVKFASFKSIYRESSTSKKLAAAAAFSDLTPDQRTRLSEIADGYKRSARAANDRWAAAQQDAEAAGKTMGGPGMQMRFKDDADGKDELAEARQARRDLDKKSAEDLDSLLTDEQKGRLPKTNLAKGGGKGPHGEDMDFLIDDDGEGSGAVFITATHSMTDDGSGGEPVTSHTVIVTTPSDDAPKKDEKKKDKK